jgi:hypothetical protein
MSTRDKRGLDTFVDEVKTINAGEGIVATPVGSEVLVSLSIPELTEDPTPDPAADYTVVFDTSAAVHKKVLLQNVPAGGTASAIASQVDIIPTGTNDWVKPAGARAIHVICIGGGGGGGSGMSSNSSRRGGTGGGGGALSCAWFDPAGLPGTVECVSGAGGAGGAGTLGAAGNAGATGTPSRFGTYLEANGGAGGAAGIVSTSAASDAAGGTGMFNGAAGGGGDYNVTGTSIAGLNSYYSGAGGGAGAGCATTTTAYGPAGNGGFPVWTPLATTPGGTSGAAPTAGTAGTDQGLVGAPSNGGGGGGATITAGVDGANGGAGGRGGGGGGGGGCCLATRTSGSGGDGGDGMTIVITFF